MTCITCSIAFYNTEAQKSVSQSMTAMNVHSMEALVYSSAQQEREWCFIRGSPVHRHTEMPSKDGGGSNVYTVVRLGGRMEEGHSTITVCICSSHI